jgi:sialate O-acetylesterase
MPTNVFRPQRVLTAIAICVCSLLLASSSVAQQALRVPSFFSDHMVVQQKVPVAVWGWAKPGDRVKLEFHGNTSSAKADDKTGKWNANLPACDANSEGTSLTIKSGDQKILINDVLVGEVWFASGQSNMVWPVSRSENAEAAIASANYPGVRMYLADTTPADEQQEDIKGAWNVCTPENAGAFSAAGYFFAKKIHEETGLPVGVIKSCWGGKRCECYCSREAMVSNPHGKLMIEELDKQAENYNEEAARERYDKAVAAWKEKSDKIRKENQVEGAKKKRIPRKPQFQTHPLKNPGNPTVLYNGMIHPFVGYKFRGAIWYQGEANGRANLAPIYREMMTLMIQDWRTRWDSEFPFYFVQLANFKKPTDEPGVDSEWATVQNQQRLTLEYPKTGMATINDIGAANDIHPKNKKDVGERLARWALKNEYGKSVVVSGPLYKSMTISDSKATIHFDHVAEGLKSRDGEKLKRFEIAGEDKKWHWGEAAISGSTVVVSSPNVPKPVAVRYAWAANPVGANLVNSEGLPTSIFRTDDWKASFQQ